MMVWRWRWRHVDAGAGGPGISGAVVCWLTHGAGGGAAAGDEKTRCQLVNHTLEATSGARGNVNMTASLIHTNGCCAKSKGPYDAPHLLQGLCQSAAFRQRSFPEGMESPKSPQSASDFKKVMASVLCRNIRQEKSRISESFLAQVSN